MSCGRLGTVTAFAAEKIGGDGLVLTCSNLRFAVQVNGGARKLAEQL